MSAPPIPATRSARPRIAALTHVRHDDVLLDLWVRHYGRLVGRQNCFVILDGDDWQSPVDLSGVNVIPLPRPMARMNRVRIDRRMQRQQLDLMARLFDDHGYDYVVKGDCDEYLVPDPRGTATLADVVAEADAVGVVYSSGIDVLHDTAREPPLDPARDVMSQRHLASLSQSYCKVNLIGRAAHRQGVTLNAGGHRASADLPVHVSQGYYMIHLGWCDRPLWAARVQPRLDQDRGDSFRSYFDDRARIFDAAGAAAPDALPFDPAMAAARAELCFTDGVRVHHANRFQGGNFAWAGARDYLVRLDDRFHGTVGG